MKKILLTIVLILGILSCGMPKEVEYPDENLKFENSTVLYKNKKYTGKIMINDQSRGITGELNLKDGQLDGKGIFKDKNYYLLEYNIMNGKLEGKLVEKIKTVTINSEYKDGNIKKFHFENGNLEMDFTFDDDGKANGNEIVKELEEIVAYKDGVAIRTDLNTKYMKYINKDGELVAEAYSDSTGILKDMVTFEMFTYDREKIELRILAILKK